MSKAVVLLGDLGLDHQGFPPTPVLAGSPDVLVDGKPVARLGDPLAPHSKPKHPPHPRAIAGGSGTVMINGQPAAITGSAVTCGGVTIGTGSVIIGDTHSPAAFSGISPMVASARGASAVAETALVQQQAATPQKLGATSSPAAQHEALGFSANSSSESASSLGLSEKTNRDLSEPGFHVVRRPMSKNELLTLLYGDASAKPDNFDRVNPDLGSSALPGEMIVVADPNSFECTTEENDLMQVARQINQEVHKLSEQEAQFVVDHYDLLEVMTSSAATGLGVGATMIGQQIKSINATLKELEVLHQDTFRKHGTLSHPEFFERRQRLFAKLDFALGKVARKGMSLDDNAKLKRALGLSSKSIVHEWRKSGVGGIPGYGTHYSKAAIMGRVVQGTGSGLIVLEAGLGVLNVTRACVYGLENECEAAVIEEPSKFGGTLMGASLGSKLGGACLLLGVTTGIGGVACSVIATGVGSLAGGYLGGKGGAIIGTKVREVIVDD